jgi:hypothetical protein
MSLRFQDAAMCKQVCPAYDRPKQKMRVEQHNEIGIILSSTLSLESKCFLLLDWTVTVLTSPVLTALRKLKDPLMVSSEHESHDRLTISWSSFSSEHGKSSVHKCRPSVQKHFCHFLDKAISQHFRTRFDPSKPLTSLGLFDFFRL